MKLLHLTLKGKWFRKIDEGRKRHEFREVKPYWIKRLEGKHFDAVQFTLGYARNAPRMRFAIAGITKRKVKGVELYVIELGIRLSCQ